jgi:formylglycine-generating enzyme required for sulfatase activity
VTTSTILFLTAISGLLGPIADSPADNAPPGMVFIAGGRFDIGADEKDIKKLMEEKQNRSLASEFPPESVNVEDFFIMPTEVTNEQFAKFVAATGGEPPQLWRHGHRSGWPGVREEDR